MIIPLTVNEILGAGVDSFIETHSSETGGALRDAIHTHFVNAYLQMDDWGWVGQASDR